MNGDVMKQRTYVSFLAREDDYLKGLLVLCYSLQKSNPRYPFLLLTASSLSRPVLNKLEANNISVRMINPLESPIRGWTHRRWRSTYSKLRIFEQTEYEKIVYLDADMLICKNIDELFDKPHMSAVNSGGMLPEYPDWIQLNSGLLVIEPAKVDVNDMHGKIGEVGVRGSGDQGFLHAYYPDWPKQADLHLDHKFNLFHSHLDRYHELFGYRLIDSTTISESEREDEKTVHVVHYIGRRKPWHTRSRLASMTANRPLLRKSLRLWHDFHRESKDSA